MPSTKNTRIRTAGKATILPTARMIRKSRMPIITSFVMRFAAYSDRNRNKVTADHSISQKKEPPLHKVLASRTMIPTKIISAIRKNGNVNCHIAVASSF